MLIRFILTRPMTGAPQAVTIVLQVSGEIWIRVALRMRMSKKKKIVMLAT